MANTDARPVIRKNAVARVYVPIYNTAGTLVTGGLTGITANVSKDGGSFGALASGGAATEIGTTGIVAVDIAAADVNTDATILRVTVSNTDAVTAVLCLYPEEAGDIRTNVTQINSDSALIAKFAAAVSGNLVGTLTGAQQATELVASTPAAATADLYNGRFLLMLSGGLAGKATKITDYAYSAPNGVFTVESLGSAPSSGDTFLIL
jgi:hypothetical protein